MYYVGIGESVSLFCYVFLEEVVRLVKVLWFFNGKYFFLNDSIWNIIMNVKKVFLM